ncbi:TPA: hypothetical protein ACNIEN_005476, partial [Klebsiella pneumoniae]
RQTNQKTDTGKTLTRWPVFVDHFNYSKAELVSRVFLPRLESLLDNQVEIAAEFSCTKSIERLVKTAESNDGVVNYWA